MKKTLITLALVMLTGCCTGIRPEALDKTLVPVLDRHDAYVRGDESLSPVQKRVYLRSSQELRKVHEEAKKP